MALPPLFQSDNLTDIPYAKSDGVIRPDSEVVEPGEFFDGERHNTITAHYPDVVQVTDFELTGTDPSSALWTLTVTPITTQSGAAAAAHGMSPESVEFQAAADTFDDVVLGLIAAIDAAGTATTLSSLGTWSRIRSYVIPSVSPLNPHAIRLTAPSSNFEFSAVLTSSVGGDGYTETAIASPVTDTAKVGFYMARDTSKGNDGWDANGNPYITQITAATPASEILGPVYHGADTQEVERGFAYREYDAGQNVPLVYYGHVCAYGDKVIQLTGGKEPVYVRHTASGDFLPGMVSDAAGAAAGATAAVVTVTPVAANSTLYEYDVIFGGATIGTVSYTSSGAATADEIAGEYRTQLAAIASAYFATNGVVPYTLDAAFGSPVVLTGSADGTSVVLAPTAANVGDNGIVATTPAVSTHTLLTRGDQFHAPSKRIGPVRIEVPIANSL